MSRLLRSPALIAFAALALTACASAPPPPPPPSGNGAALRDWRSIVTSADRDRYARRDAAWSLALQQARRQPGSGGDLRSLGDLIDPDMRRAPVAPPPGDYRCRTVKLGSQGGEQGLGYVVYGWFSCRIEQTPRGLKFSKITGSQRPSGLLFPENDRQMILLGSLGSPKSPPPTPTVSAPTAT